MDNNFNEHPSGGSAVHPTGYLVPVYAAHTDQTDTKLTISTTLALAKAAAARGETVLMLDMLGGALMKQSGIITGVSLSDVLYKNADIRDAKYISHNEHFTAAFGNPSDLDALLGSLAALSLNYDWVFVATEAGCTPAHVKLASAADTALLGFTSDGDRFMRAYWMLDAIRSRAPKFDPLILVQGEEFESFETYDMFASTVREFLGAPPALGGILETVSDVKDIAPTLLESLRQEVLGNAVQYNTAKSAVS